MYRVAYIRTQEDLNGSTKLVSFNTVYRYIADKNDAMNSAMAWCERNHRVISNKRVFLYGATIYENGFCVLIIDYDGNVLHNLLV